MTADATTMTSYTRTYLDQTSKREDSLLFRNADAAAIPCNAGGAMKMTNRYAGDYTGIIFEMTWVYSQPTWHHSWSQSASNATGL